jgi:hypothetical protein
MMGQSRLSLRQLADAFPAARRVRAFNTLQARVLADENHRLPRWALFLSGAAVWSSAVAVRDQLPGRPLGITVPLSVPAGLVAGWGAEHRR